MATLDLIDEQAASGQTRLPSGTPSQRLTEICRRTFAEEAYAGSTRADTVLVTLNDEGDRPAIFWFPSVAGIGTDALRLALELGPAQPFHVLRVPHNWRNAAKGADLHGLAAAFAEAIAAAAKGRPVVLGTWSAGTIAALAALPMLAAYGVTVSRIVVVDFVPELPRRRFSLLARPVYRPILSIHKMLQQSASLGDLAARLRAKIKEQVIDRLASARGSLPPAPHPMAASPWYPRLGADHRGFVERFHDACAAFRPVHCGVPVVLLVAQPYRDGVKRRLLDALAAPWSMAARWRDFAPKLSVIPYPGDHETLKTAPRVIAESLRQALSAEGAAHNG